jgi:hypothetical protein
MGFWKIISIPFNLEFVSLRSLFTLKGRFIVQVKFFEAFLISFSSPQVIPVWVCRLIADQHFWDLSIKSFSPGQGKEIIFWMTQIFPPFIKAGFHGFIIPVIINIQSRSRERHFQAHEPGL